MSPDAAFYGTAFFANVSGGVDIHYHGSAETGAAYSLDLRRVLTTAGEVGLVIVPSGSGEPSAFVLAATPAVRTWIEEGLAGEARPWQPPVQSPSGSG
jgi:hypothetical protein